LTSGGIHIHSCNAGNDNESEGSDEEKVLDPSDQTRKAGRPPGLCTRCYISHTVYVIVTKFLLNSSPYCPGDKGKFVNMAKEVLEIMQRCNEDLSKANKEDDMRARNLWMMMKPLEEKRIQDNKRAKYGNVAERKAYGIMHNFFMALPPAIAPGEASRGGDQGVKNRPDFFWWDLVP